MADYLLSAVCQRQVNYTLLMHSITCIVSGLAFRAMIAALTRDKSASSPCFLSSNRSITERLRAAGERHGSVL